MVTYEYDVGGNILNKKEYDKLINMGIKLNEYDEKYIREKNKK